MLAGRSRLGRIFVVLCFMVCASREAKQPYPALDVNTARLGTASAAVAGAGTRAASVAVTARVVGSARRVLAVVCAHVSAVHESDNGSDGEENDVHDTKCPACLEHRTRLVVDEVVAGANDTDIASRQVPVVGTADADAVGVPDVAQEVNGGNKGTEKEGINECDEVGICRGAVVAEKGEDCPSKSKNGDDEEDQD